MPPDLWSAGSLKPACPLTEKRHLQRFVATISSVLRTAYSHTSLAFASCSIAHIRGRNLAVKVKTGRGMAAPPAFGHRLSLNVGGGATRRPNRAQNGVVTHEQAPSWRHSPLVCQHTGNRFGLICTVAVPML